ncbi:hypothetical protein [Pseudomonas asplenii]|uniref:hypothetical protein n=1 Tax=Pseudomonas asplenii TaxID=53407 RepID=UPI00039B4F36|nr:hypothetical protein [Pseudomonas fuscovaginae]
MSTTEVKPYSAMTADSPSLAAPIPLNTLPDNGDGQVNLLPSDQGTLGVEVAVYLWPHPAGEGQTDIIDFYINGTWAAGQRLVGPVTELSLPRSFLVPGRELSIQGTPVISYQVANGDGNRAYSFPLTVTIDTTTPNGTQVPRAIGLPTNLPQKTVTLAYLQEHGNRLQLTIPPYTGYRVGDRWQLFVRDGDTPYMDGPVPSAAAFEIELTTEQFFQLGEEPLDLTYRIVNRAGNPSQESIRERLTVMLYPRVEELATPELNHTFINRQAIRDGVVASIEFIKGTRRGDRVVPFLSGLELPVITLTDVQAFPLRFDIGWSAFSFHGTHEPYTANLLYFVQRGSFTSPPSRTLSVPVDLSLPGDDNPELNPINPQLPIPEMRGATSNHANHLNAQDKDKPVKVTFNLPEGQLLTGDRFRVFYAEGTQPVAEHPIDGFEGGKLSLDVPWAIIAGVGNGRHNLFYEVVGSHNAQQSPRVQVVVDIFDDVGALRPLELPVRDADKNMINCYHRPWEGIPVRLHDPDSLREGDVVSLHWVINNDRGGGTPVQATRVSYRYPVDAGIAKEGLVVIVNWQHIEPVVDGLIEVYWRLERPASAQSAQSTVTGVILTRKTAGAPCHP